jgi:radical SAM superfamily enzyme YgiQ (UPF0313 family)
MPKKKISFVNPNFQQGPKEFNAYYLPYSPAVLWSYASQFDIIKDNYELGEFIWRRETISDAIEMLADSDIVGLSTYIWNRSYNHVLGRELRKANPNIFIFTGGPEPPITDPKFFERFPYIDVAVKQEGEISVKNILECLLGNRDNMKNIPGLLINDNGKIIDTGPGIRIEKLDEIPSPYLTDVF